jgi:exonuclease III
MKSTTKEKRNNVRASPLSDGQRISPANPSKRKPNRKTTEDANDTLSKIRISSWNVGSLTGRSNELADVLHRRSISICCLQETRWKGAKSRDIGNNYQLIYNGTTNARNGVGIVLDGSLRDRIVKVERISDRIISVKLAMDGQPCLNVVSAYAPQSGCDSSEKQQFWDDMEEVLQNIPGEETKMIGGDLNGHVGEQSIVFDNVHGNYGYGTCNDQGKDILNFASTYNMAIVNTFFKKKEEHLITYKSGRNSSQIDYILVDRSCLNRFKDCKVIPGEALTAQHRILVANFTLPSKLKQPKILGLPRIKWYKLKESEGNILCENMKAFLESGTSNAEGINEMWDNLEKQCLSEAAKTLGTSKGALQSKKETGWWTEDVKKVLSEKKRKFKIWQSTRSETDFVDYKAAKKDAKRMVAQAKAASNESFYKSLEDCTNEHDIFKVAKHRNQQTKDMKHNKYINNKDGKLLTSDRDINQRWFEYYNQLLNEEFPKENRTPELCVAGPIPEVCFMEVKREVSRMKNNKAAGPDGIPAEIWKRLGDAGISWLTNLFNRILREKQIPESWRKSYLVPFYKNKGDVRDCGNYRGVKLTSHTLKIWERVINQRLLTMTEITPNQHGFVSGKSTTDALQTMRILLEKYKGKKKNLHMAFIDLEKAFDRIPRLLVWQSIRAQGVPEYYVDILKAMYRDPITCVRSPAGTSAPFVVNVGVHQGSALSPLLFNLAINYLTRSIQKPTPWNILYADDIVLISESPQELQESLEQWRVALEGNGLRISRSKTEYMSCNFSGTTQPASIHLEGAPIKQVDHFTYLGSVFTKDGKLENDVEHRIKVGWLKWRALSGVLCDSKVPVRTKGKVYKTAVRPAMLYGSECWALRRQEEQRLHVAEMKMLRWAAGVTRLDKIRNEYVRGSLKVAPVGEKARESRLRWYGHVCRRGEDHIVRKALQLDAGRRGPGRPPATWLSTVKNDMRVLQIDSEMAQDRGAWREHVRRADPN